MEPTVGMEPIAMLDTDASLASAAVSLKRIADALGLIVRDGVGVKTEDVRSYAPGPEQERALHRQVGARLNEGPVGGRRD